MKNTIEVDVKHRQTEILNRVVSRGLLSAQDQRREGYEPFHSKTSTGVVVCGRLIQPTSLWEAMRRAVSGKTAGDQVKEALYSDAWSVFPVVAERGDQDSYAVYNIPDEDLEERFRRSAVAIIPVTPKVNLTITEESFFIDRHGKKRVIDRKYGLESPVLTDQIEIILVPAMLGEILTELPPTKISLMQVGKREERLFWKSRGRNLEVPDYEAEIKRQLARHKESLFIHGIRLPTGGDVLSG